MNLQAFDGILDKISKETPLMRADLSMLSQLSHHSINKFLRPGATEATRKQLLVQFIDEILRQACDVVDLTPREFMQAFNCCSERRMMFDILEEPTLESLTFAVRYDPCDYCTLLFYAILKWRELKSVKALAICNYYDKRLRNFLSRGCKTEELPKIIELQNYSD